MLYHSVAYVIISCSNPTTKKREKLIVRCPAGPACLEPLRIDALPERHVWQMKEESLLA